MRGTRLIAAGLLSACGVLSAAVNHDGATVTRVAEVRSVHGQTGASVLPPGADRRGTHRAASDADAREIGKPSGLEGSADTPGLLARPHPPKGPVDPHLMESGASVGWSNLGGNAQRNGRSAGDAPTEATLLWSNTTDFSIIAWHPVTLEGRVFAIRESGFPGTNANDALVAYDLESGAELWRTVVPYGGNPALEWIAHVMGASDGRVYAGRGGSGRETPVYAFDAATGNPVWTSELLTSASPQETVAFAPDGDLIVGDSLIVSRLESSDGSTIWSVPRLCAVSGNCAAALGADGVFIDEPFPGFQQVVVKLDLETGARLYASTPMPGLTVQNAPFVSADGQTVYLARTQSNIATDFLFAFEDTGSALVERWHRPMRWTTSHEHGLASDGSIYTFLPGNEFVRLDAQSGEVTASAGVLAPIDSSLSPRTAVAADGTVYVSNGWAGTPAANGRIWAFSPDLSAEHFVLTLDRQNSGGPSIGRDGTLVVADRVGVRAYRSASARCVADLDRNDTVNGADLALVLGAWGGSGAADLSGNGSVDGADIAIVLGNWGPCPR